MFNPTSVVATAFGTYLADLYTEHFSGRKPEYAAFIGGAARLVLERLGNTDALYHNAEHTMMVTLLLSHDTSLEGAGQIPEMIAGSG